VNEFTAADPKQRAQGHLRSRPVPAGGGFVLVEVIVVAVIVAVLSAVAIPIYSGMVKSQRMGVARGISQSAAVSANVYYRRYGVNPVCVTTAACVTTLGLFLTDASKYSISLDADEVIVRDVSLAVDDTVKTGFH
jgi:Tfp pilus assembly protein PilE